MTVARTALERLNLPTVGSREHPETIDVMPKRWGSELADHLSLAGSVAPEELLAYDGASFPRLGCELQ